MMKPKGRGGAARRRLEVRREHLRVIDSGALAEVVGGGGGHHVDVGGVRHEYGREVTRYCIG